MTGGGVQSSKWRGWPRGSGSGAEGHSVITLCKYFCCTLPPALLLFFLALFFSSLPLALPSQIFISICELRFSFSLFPSHGKITETRLRFCFSNAKGILLSVDVSGVIARAALSAARQIGGHKKKKKTVGKERAYRSWRCECECVGKALCQIKY